MKSRILIIGGSGLLGTNWAVETRSSHDVTLALNHRIISIPGTSALTLDWLDDEESSRAFASISPDLVVHAAGLTSVEKCESDPVSARVMNSDLASRVARTCAQLGIKLIHISTDHLFDGTRPELREDTSVCPLNVYGKTKADAEVAVLKECPDALVVRTNFYGWGPPYRRSFSDWIVDSLSSGKTIDAFEDVFYSPLLVTELIEVAMQLAQIDISGIVHVAGPERISKYDFASKLAAAMKLDASLLRKARQADFKNLVLRPRDMSLSSEKAFSILQRNPGTIDDHLRKLIVQREEGRLQLFQNL